MEEENSSLLLNTLCESHFKAYYLRIFLCSFFLDVRSYRYSQVIRQVVVVIVNYVVHQVSTEDTRKRFSGVKHISIQVKDFPIKIEDIKFQPDILKALDWRGV